jgi:rhamnosyltransferase
VNQITNPLCSIIVRCYNEEKYIGRLLNGIVNQSIKSLEIIIVDSGSIDSTISIVTKFPVKIEYISPEDFSFGRALNRGCLIANGKFLVFISAHCWPVYQDWLKQLLAPFTDPKIALVYGKQRGTDITRFSEHQIFRGLFPNKSNFQQKIPFCNNANCAIRKELWEKYPFDEDLTGLEDIYWGKKAIELGNNIAYSADAEIIHAHQENNERIFKRYYREAIALKNIIPSSHFSLWDLLRLTPHAIISDCYEAKRKNCFLSCFREIVEFRYLQYWGAYKGFNQQKPLSKQMLRTLYYPKKNGDSENMQENGKKSKKIDYNILGVQYEK